MAFNFNWSPLIADTTRAREMLTTALNKSPKPPIIVDDIIVTELNLGSTAPELEILEVGDLAQDRFRGIFKMQYTGDAFLTLKTKVQANPLNTYLSTKPSFASPEPLAASSGLTIPLQITLSDIRLSGFVILVFSRQKGLTLVFRNDPLESLKVSSTFDSIPFVRDYLQKEIEKQLRVLFMDDLPAIIHRLSLRLWSPEYAELDVEQRLDGVNDTAQPIDPLSTPPQDAVDAFGNPLSENQISSLSLDPSSELHASFSQKNILRLAALSESHRTLSLFTPSLRETVFRAWAGASERLESPGTATPPLTLSSLSRIQSSFSSLKSSPSSLASGSTGGETVASRPSLAGFSSQYGGTLGGGRSRRKGKKRVVNLRRGKEDGESSGLSTEASTPAPSANVSETASVIPEEREEDLATPPRSPAKHLRFQGRHGSLDVGQPATLPEQTATEPTLAPVPEIADPPAPRPKSKATPPSRIEIERPIPIRTSTSRPPLRHAPQATTPLLRSLSMDKLPFHHATTSMLSPSAYPESTSSSGGILEQAWMLKMAQEIARKVQVEKEKEARRGRPRPRGEKVEGAGGMWESSEEEEMEAPPAYVA